MIIEIKAKILTVALKTFKERKILFLILIKKECFNDLIKKPMRNILFYFHKPHSKT